VKNRYYLSETSGYVYDTTGVYEYEYAVVDEVYGTTVGLFIARGTRGKWSYIANKKRALARAERFCGQLNARENGQPYSPSALEPNYSDYPPRRKSPSR
jgi:hypothetical protein